MEDAVSSSVGEVKLPEPAELKAPQQQEDEVVDEDDILDLAGGAQDALARHRASSRRQENQRQDPDDKPAQIKASSALLELLYWRDLQRTGVCFGATLFLLLSLSVCSIISVLAYISLALLSVTICFRIYKGIIQAVQKSEDGHPFKMYLEQDVTISAEVVQKNSEVALTCFNTAVKELRHIFLVEDLVDSLKFALLMWILTYIGALFNGLTLIIIAHVALFTWPVIYEKHQVQIDHYYGLVNKQIKDVVKKIQAKIPGAKPKAE